VREKKTRNEKKEKIYLFNNYLPTGNINVLCGGKEGLGPENP
jgi:hypothetical protein